ncbi:MAG: GGDEF domain-containing protein, partial [Planctomycetes bacterium]|nr:GGDEF domain-containing protein [Planctomycetota bacterium]
MTKNLKSEEDGAGSPSLAAVFAALNAAARQGHTYDPRANAFLRLGFFLGLPILALAVARLAPAATAGGSLTSGGGIMGGVGGPAGGWPDFVEGVLLLCYPFLCMWILGLVGTLVRTREEQRARDMEELSRRATHDGLTGMLNHAQILERLSGELERARREEYPVACLMIDLDNLKPINDSLGHLAGDRALTEIAAVIRRECRSYDATGRYGGDEFLAVLPRCDTVCGLKLAERIRRAVGDRSIQLASGGKAIRTTVSIGVASFPEDGLVRAALVAVADEGLYLAKRSGRTRVAATGVGVGAPAGVAAGVGGTAGEVNVHVASPPEVATVAAGERPRALVRAPLRPTPILAGAGAG